MISSELGQAAASPVPIQWDGKEILLQPFTLHDFGVVTNYLLKRKQDALLRMIAAQRENLPADIWREEWDKAKKDAQDMKVPPQEVAGGVDSNGVEHPNWMDSNEGIAFTLWLLFEKTFPGKYTRRDIEDTIGKMAIESVEQLKNDRDRVAGLDEASLKNSEGPGVGEKDAPAEAGKEVEKETAAVASAAAAVAV